MGEETGSVYVHVIYQQMLTLNLFDGSGNGTFTHTKPEKKYDTNPCVVKFKIVVYVVISIDIEIKYHHDDIR